MLLEGKGRSLGVVIEGKGRSLVVVLREMEEFLPFPSITTTSLVFSCLFLLLGKLNWSQFWKEMLLVTLYEVLANEC